MKDIKIAFQGELGAYSHIACEKLFPGSQIKACPTFEETFRFAHQDVGALRPMRDPFEVWRCFWQPTFEASECMPCHHLMAAALRGGKGTETLALRGGKGTENLGVCRLRAPPS